MVFDKRRQQNKLDNKGFSLVEVLVAVIILAIMTLPMLQTFANSAIANNRARKVEEATAIAQRVMERCKALSIDELLGTRVEKVTVGGVETEIKTQYMDLLKKAADGNGTVSAPDGGAWTSINVNNTLAGVTKAEARAFFVKDRTDGSREYNYAYRLTMATMKSESTGVTFDKDNEGVDVYKGSNGVNYYVQTLISPYQDDSDGIIDASDNEWFANIYEMPRYADIKGTTNYIFMDEIYEYDNTIKTILPTRHKIIADAVYGTDGRIVQEASTTKEDRLDKLIDIKKVVVLNVTVKYDATQAAYIMQPTLQVKYFRPWSVDDHGINLDSRKVNSKGEIYYDVAGSPTIDSSSDADEVFIKEKKLGESKVSKADYDAGKVDFKDIYIFYMSYDRKYNKTEHTGGLSDYYTENTGGFQASDEVYVNLDYESGFIPNAEHPVNVYIVEQYVASNNSDPANRDSFKDNVQIYLKKDNVTMNINGTESLYTSPVKNGSALSVYSNINGWYSNTIKSNITQNFRNMNEEMLYTITVKVWAAEEGKAPVMDDAHVYYTLRSSKYREE